MIVNISKLLTSKFKFYVFVALKRIPLEQEQEMGCAKMGTFLQNSYSTKI